MINNHRSSLKEVRLNKKLEGKIKSHTATVGIIGMGYVGLPLAVELGNQNFNVIGIDINPKKVSILSSGKSDIDDISDQQVRVLVKAKKLRCTADFSALTKCDVVPICVPTPLNKTKDPDVSFILSATHEIRKYLHPGQLVILESTTYPGTTEELLRPILESTGLKVGKDFFLAFSPERVDPGNTRFGTKNTPRVVGGTTPTCNRLAKFFYEQIINRVIPLSSTQSAEMVKLLENTFRSVNIGLVNEVALMCDKLGINVWEIIEAADSKPFGFMKFYPGPGLGGHCIPIDPHYLSWKLKALNYYARFIELAGDVNSHMPEYVVHRVNRVLNQKGKNLCSSNILILGAAYKKDIKDLRESPALDVIRLFQKEGAHVKYSDPHVPSIDMDTYIMRSVKLTPQLLAKSDCVVVVTDHTAYDYEWVVRHSQMVFDTRNATRNVRTNRKKIFTL